MNALTARSCGKEKSVAQISKKRARELKKDDKFKQTTMRAFDRAGNVLEGKGRTMLYVIGAVVALAVLAGAWTWWSNRKSDEARAALGRAIEVAETPVSPTPAPGSTTPSFPTERERAQKAVEEFQKVADKYGDPYDDIARFMAATQMLEVERAKGISQLAEISKNGSGGIATRARFALAQAKESDGQHDEAAALYQELLKANESSVVPDTINLRLAAVYEKQGKKSEAVEILFRIVEAARNAKDKDGKPAPTSDAASDAAKKLETLDPARYAQLPPEPPRAGMPF